MNVASHFGVLREALRAEKERDKTRRVLAETDFLPAALEVLETPPNPLGRWVLWVLIAFLLIAVVWACVGNIDVVAAANGKIIPRGQVKVIQAADAGVVRDILVFDGQEVRAGQKLIVFDPTAAETEAEQARQSFSVAEADKSRAQALVDSASGAKGAAFAPPASAPDVEVQKALVAARIAQHRGELEALKAERAQRRGELAMVGAEVQKIEAQLPLMEEQLAGLKTLEEKGFSPRMKVAEFEQKAIGQRQDLIIRKAERDKQAAALAAVEQQIAKLQGEFSATSLDALNEANANFRLRAEEVKKAEDKAALTVLSSPIDGVVAQLKVHTIGAVVKPADPLLLIVPKNSELMVEAMVLNRDAGFIREGQSVEVKLEAFPFTRYGVVKGQVERISRDSVQDEKLGLVYPAQVKLSQTQIRVDGRMTKLEPGLAATAEIKTGQRRIIEYLLSPLARRVSEAGRER
jgi:hemolysin D